MSKTYEKTDLRFADFIVSPSETFADTMRLQYGWCTPGPEQQENVPYLLVDDGVEVHIDAMQAFVSMTIQNFGLGTEEPAGGDEIRAFVENCDNQDAVGVYTFLDLVIAVSAKYLRGDGDNYRLLGQLANRDGYDIFVN